MTDRTIKLWLYCSGLTMAGYVAYCLHIGLHFR